MSARGVVAPDGVQHVDPIAHELRCCDRERILAGPDESALLAIGGIAQLHARVPERTSPEVVRGVDPPSDLCVDDDRVAGEDTCVSTPVSENRDRRITTIPFLDQRRDRG
jgi:hypothetical protein